MLTGSADKTIKLWKAGRCERTFSGKITVDSFVISLLHICTGDFFFFNIEVLKWYLKKSVYFSHLIWVSINFLTVNMSYLFKSCAEICHKTTRYGLINSYFISYNMAMCFYVHYLCNFWYSVMFWLSFERFSLKLPNISLTKCGSIELPSYVRTTSLMLLLILKYIV